MTAPLIGAASPLRALKRDRRFVSSRLRVLMLRDRYHVQEECRAAWVALGHEVIDVWLGPSPSPEAMLQAVLNAIVAWRPDMVMSINFFGFDRQNWMAEVLNAAGMPCAVWCVDSPLLTLRGWLPQVHDQLHLFVWDRSYVPYLRSLGVEHVHHLPLAAAQRRFAAVQTQQPHAYPACFIGGSLHHAAEVWGKTLSDAQRARAPAWADALRADPGALHTLVPQPAAPPCPDILLLGMAQAKVSAHKRRAALASLPRDELHVWGDEGWRDALSDVQLHGRCAYGSELDGLSAQSDVTLNVTSAQMPTGVNQRIFDVPHSGNFLLTDAQDEVYELFEHEREVATFSAGDNCAARYDYYRRHPDKRAQIIVAAQARIAREHLYEHRVASIEATMRRSCAPRLVRAHPRAAARGDSAQPD